MTERKLTFEQVDGVLREARDDFLSTTSKMLAATKESTPEDRALYDSISMSFSIIYGAFLMKAFKKAYGIGAGGEA